MTEPMPDRELEEARRLAKAWLAEEVEGVDTAAVFKLARAFLALDCAGGRSEREERLRVALAAYRSALRSRETETAQLRELGDAALTAQDPPPERQGE